jgi:hypothetical protein
LWYDPAGLQQRHLGAYIKEELAAGEKRAGEKILVLLLGSIPLDNELIFSMNWLCYHFWQI